MTETPSFENVYTKRRRIAWLAKQNPQMAFTSLNHYLDVDWLRTAFHLVRKDGAPGVDGQTWHDYEARLEENLQSLLVRAKSGTYRAPPVRRVHIPKGGSSTETRPIGIPTIEDKLLQRAVVMLLEAIYERDFYACSFGFRRWRSAHQALETLWEQSMNLGVRWILDVDVRKFFDTLDHHHLRELLQLRVRDGVILRLIGKWLNAGVMEDGATHYSDTGSPQGGVISPILANVYLHYVLDQWFHEVVLPRLRGRAYLIRFADDFVIGFTDETDARRVLEVVSKRFAKYGLAIHPEKTRLVPFGKPHEPGRRLENMKPETFDFLGFTHYWAKSRRGQWVIKRKTASSRLSRSLQAISVWCRIHRHQLLAEQHAALTLKLRGHYQYYGITGNSAALGTFARAVTHCWFKWLRRRHRTRPSWAWFQRLLARFPLPSPRAIHSLYHVAKE
jgi:RNA-directed DNA polymerase